MDSQCGEPKVLERVKRKRRLSSCEDGSNTTGSSSRLSMFVQSALQQTPVEDGAGMSRHDNGRPRQSGSSSRKKQRLAAGELEKRLEAVQFPGYSEEEREEEEERGGSIDVFSESGSEMSTLEEIDEGEERETQVPTAISVWKRRKERIRNRHRRTSDQSCTFPSSAVAGENILEFDSCLSDDSTPESPAEPVCPPTHLHTSTPLTTVTSPPHTSTPVSAHLNPPPRPPRQTSIMTLGEFRSLLASDDNHHSIIATPTPEYQSIVTPPSSPEATSPYKRSGVKHTTASEWARQITLESDELGASTTGVGDTVCGLSDSVFVRGLGESVGRGRGKRRTAVAGGLAALAETVAQRETSEIAFWEHRARQMDDSNTDVSVCMTVEVMWLSSSHSLKVTSCRIVTSGHGGQPAHPASRTESTPGSEENVRGGEEGGGGGGEIVTVLFSSRCAKFLDLQVGQTIRIHPPWQCLTTPSSGQRVIFCTHFCLLLTSPPSTHSPTARSTLHHLPTPPSLTSSHTRGRSRGGLCQIRSPHKSPSSHIPSLTRSPSQFGVIPKILFPASDPHRCHPQETNTPASATLPPLSPTTTASSSGGDATSRVCSGLLDAMEGSTRGGLLSLQCRVLRLYRRPITSCVTLGKEVKQWASGGRTSKVSQKCRWCLLVCDATGLLCELQLTQIHNPTWTEVVRRGEGKVYVFRNVRIFRRTNPARNPELFSLIRCLCHQLAHAPSTPTSTQSQSLDRGVSFQSAGPVPIPSYCYVLVSGPESVPVPCQEEGEGLFPMLVRPTVSSAVDRGCDNKDWEVTRVDLYCRVVHCQPEIPVEETRNVPLPPHQGHYLFIVTPSLPSPLLPSSSSSSAHDHQLLRVYMKPLFSTEGVGHLLYSPGQRLLIRDLEAKTDKGSTVYSMDACSMVYLFTSKRDLPQGEETYPQYRFGKEEEQLLQSLPPPVLPLLTPQHGVGSLVSLRGDIVAVDEDSAFSWPQCDKCGNEQLSTTTTEDGKDDGLLYCDECNTKILSPSIHLQLAVYVKIAHDDSCHPVCVQLLQSTIKQLLLVSPANLDEGFDVRQVLNQSVFLDACYVQGTRVTKLGQTVPYLLEININPPETP